MKKALKFKAEESKWWVSLVMCRVQLFIHGKRGFHILYKATVLRIYRI